MTATNSIQHFSYNQDRVSTSLNKRNNLLLNLPSTASNITDGAILNDESQITLTSSVTIRKEEDEIVPVASTSESAATKNRLLSRNYLSIYVNMKILITIINVIGANNSLINEENSTNG